MAKRKVARTTQRKVKDKWKAKSWYAVRAPKMFNGVQIAETLADEPEKLIGRIAETTMQELSGDFSKMHVKVQFKVHSAHGTDAHTKYVGHVLTSDYIRRLTRRKHSKIDGVFDVTTKDGFTIRVKPMAVTERRAQSSQEQLVREIAQKVCSDAAKANEIDGFVKALLGGDLSQEIFTLARKIYPLKRVEIRKSELRSEPENVIYDTDIFAAPEEEAVEGEEGADESEDAAADEIAAALAEGVESPVEETVADAEAASESPEESSEEELTEEERV